MKETYNGIWREIASRIRLHLRGCVKVSSRCETVENKACCSDVDKRLRSLHAVLVVLTQASIAPSQAKLRSTIQVRPVIFLFAAVPSKPTKVHVEVQEVCEAFTNILFIDPCRRTAQQMSKPIKVDRFCAVGAQVGVKESCVTEFIIVIIGNILRHVAVEILECKFVGRISDVGCAIVGFGGS